MIRPFALLGFSAYGALVLCAALGPNTAWALALLCLGLACATALCRVLLGVSRKSRFASKELLGYFPKALSVLRRMFWAALALVVAGGACGMCALQWETVDPLQDLEGERLQIRGQVLEYPDEQYHRYYYKIRVEGLGEEEGEPQRVEPFQLRLSASMPIACQPYDWVECAVTFYAFDSGGGLYSTRNSRLADGFQAGGYLSQFEGITVEEAETVSPGALLVQARRQVGRELDRLLPRREAGLVRAMVLGDGSGISQEDMSHFRQLGVSHVLVVSGLHMTVLAGFLQFFLKRFPIRKAVGNLLTGMFLFLFLVLSGFQPSATRGAVMYGVLLLADSFGRRSDSLNSLGLAVLVVCAGNPFAGGDVGFALSVTATLGIILLYRPLYRAFLGERLTGLFRRLWKPAAASLGATASALLGTFPVQLGVFGGFPLLLPLANFLMVFPSTVLLYLSFCGVFFAVLPVTAPLAAPFVWIAGWAARLMLGIASFLAQWKGTFLPLTSGAALAVTVGLLLLLMMAGLVGRDKPLRAVIAGCMVALVLFGGLFQNWLDRDKAVFAVPYQEDASCVVLVRNHQAAVLSLGGFQTGVVNEILQRHNVTQVTAVCMPLTDSDAREAACQVLEEYGAGSLVLPEGAYVGRDLELAAKETPVTFLSAGESFSVMEGMTAQILPKWKGLRLTVNGVDTLVEWAGTIGQNCQVLFTNQQQTQVNSSLSVWQTDAIIGENGQGWTFSQNGESVVLPVEDGCLAVEIAPTGKITARRES